MFKIKSRSKIYIICPAYASTGGPEALHQLCHVLNELKYNAFMIYHSGGQNLVRNGKHPVYNKYNTQYAEDIEDDVDNVIIFPEIYVNPAWGHDVLNWIYTKSCQIGLWWLAAFDHNHSLNNIRPNVIHLVECHYALLSLKENNIIGYMLSDYINDDYKNIQYDKKNKDNILLYNPVKGMHITHQILKRLSNIHTIPICNMNNSQIINLINRSKVYIDFGGLPGKDRLTRETALGGCCVVLGLAGAGLNDYDLPVPNKYKIKLNDIDSSVNIINEIITNFDACHDDFESYRKEIKNNYNTFVNEINTLFIKE